MKNKILAFTFLVGSVALIEQVSAMHNAPCICNEDMPRTRACNSDLDVLFEPRIWGGRSARLRGKECYYNCHCDSGVKCMGPQLKESFAASRPGQCEH